MLLGSLKSLLQILQECFSPVLQFFHDFLHLFFFYCTFWYILLTTPIILTFWVNGPWPLHCNQGWITIRPEWQFGQRHFGRDNLARMMLWPELQIGQWHFGQRQFGQRDTLARHFGCSDGLASDSLASDSLASDILASDFLARVIHWLECHFGHSDNLASTGPW